jgi:2,4-dienoyl-CoA reductase-like NADH-dependent reductase (Old Yellow Enzyme family)
VYGATEDQWAETYPKPKALTEDNMNYIENAFVAAAVRCEKAGCKRPTDLEILCG